MENFLFNDVVCLWLFGNSLYKNGIFLIFMKGEYSLFYRYLFLGEFIIKVFCLNEISRIEFNMKVMVFKLIELFMIICLDCNFFLDLMRILFKVYFVFGDIVILLVLF